VVEIQEKKQLEHLHFARVPYLRSEMRKRVDKALAVDVCLGGHKAVESDLGLGFAYDQVGIKSNYLPGIKQYMRLEGP
jgi:hypothetical protein